MICDLTNNSHFIKKLDFAQISINKINRVPDEYITEERGFLSLVYFIF